MKIIIADDHELIRNGIKATLNTREDIEIVEEVQDGLAAMAAIEKHQPDIAILDISMPGMTGMEVLTEATDKGLPTKMIMLSMYNDYQYIDKCLELGAKAYVAKGDAGTELMEAIAWVTEGKIFFSRTVQAVVLDGYAQSTTKKEVLPQDLSVTKREREVLKMVAQGLTSVQIADSLFVSPRTVDTHRANLMRKLEVKNAVELVIKARTLNLIPN